MFTKIERNLQMKLLNNLTNLFVDLLIKSFLSIHFFTFLVEKFLIIVLAALDSDLFCSLLYTCQRLSVEAERRSSSQARVTSAKAGRYG